MKSPQPLAAHWRISEILDGFYCVIMRLNVIMCQNNNSNV